MVKKMYSVFNRSPTTYVNLGAAGYYPNSPANLVASEKSLVGAIFNRIAIDVSNNRFMHVKIDENEYIEEILDSPLNNCLLYKPNINQSVSQFKRDIVLTMCTEGIAVVAATYWDDEGKPLQLQCGVVTGWYSDYVACNFFCNEQQTMKEVHLKKSKVAIIENPLYTVMNDHASGIKRLIAKLHQMDTYTAAATSGKINAFIGLDYDTSTTIGKERAQKRIDSIESQAAASPHGIVYHENTEKITFPSKQLDIDIVEQVKYLEEQCFSEMGMTRAVFTGEAKEDANRQYNAKTVEPFGQAITEGLTTAFIPLDMYRTERIVMTKPMFSGVTGTEIADMSDKLSRNAIVKSNEVRRELGLLKSDERQANMLMNPNMPMQDQPMTDSPQTSNNLFDQTNSPINIFNKE